jgi:hypothetical protein
VLDEFCDPLTHKIVAFLRGIGLGVKTGIVLGEHALPGIDIDHGMLVVDEARLLFPGDLLHEAGHLAVVTPARRAAFHNDVGNDGGEELGAIAWSYAAAIHMGIDPALVFHAQGYRGASDSILENFAGGFYIGLPWLVYCGLAVDAGHAAGAPPYPHMIRWLKEE